MAEQAWKFGSLEKEDRNEYAKKLVADAMVEDSIAVTPQI